MCGLDNLQICLYVHRTAQKAYASAPAPRTNVCVWPWRITLRLVPIRNPQWVTGGRLQTAVSTPAVTCPARADYAIVQRGIFREEVDLADRQCHPWQASLPPPTLTVRGKVKLASKLCQSGVASSEVCPGYDISFNLHCLCVQTKV